MDEEAALQKARKMKAEALGLVSVRHHIITCAGIAAVMHSVSKRLLRIYSQQMVILSRLNHLLGIFYP